MRGVRPASRLPRGSAASIDDRGSVGERTRGPGTAPGAPGGPAGARGFLGRGLGVRAVRGFAPAALQDELPAPSFTSEDRMHVQYDPCVEQMELYQRRLDASLERRFDHGAHPDDERRFAWAMAAVHSRSFACGRARRWFLSWTWPTTRETPRRGTSATLVCRIAATSSGASTVQTKPMRVWSSCPWCLANQKKRSCPTANVAVITSSLSTGSCRWPIHTKTWSSSQDWRMRHMDA
eukprot:jgi/Pico_ML_1/55847/g1478.t1